LPVRSLGERSDREQIDSAAGFAAVSAVGTNAWRSDRRDPTRFHAGPAMGATGG
jgi:hypothetical protein